MKRLTILIAFAVVFIYGCNKEETSPSSDYQQSTASNVTIHSINFEGELIGSKVITIDAANSSTGTSTELKANNNQHLNGHYHTQAGSVVNGSAVVNNGGTHGNMNINFASGEELKLSTSGLEIEGNQAAIGGQITQTSGFPEGHPFSVIGNYFYTLVEDNGEGNNAPSDRYSEQLFWSPEELGDLTFLLTPNSGAWNPALLSDTAEESDQIQVSGGN